MADVSVFNLYNEPIYGFVVEGFAAGRLAPRTGEFNLGSLRVPRSKNRTSAASFALGNNEIRFPWDSFTGADRVAIPDPVSSAVSLDDPLILLLATNQAILLTTGSRVLDSFPVSLQPN